MIRMNKSNIYIYAYCTLSDSRPVFCKLWLLVSFDRNLKKLFLLSAALTLCQLGQ